MAELCEVQDFRKKGRVKVYFCSDGDPVRRGGGERKGGGGGHLHTHQKTLMCNTITLTTRKTRIERKKGIPGLHFCGGVHKGRIPPDSNYLSKKRRIKGWLESAKREDEIRKRPEKSPKKGKSDHNWWEVCTLED